MDTKDWELIRGIALASIDTRFYERVKATFETWESGGIDAKDAREDLELMLFKHYVELEINKMKAYNNE